MAIVFDKENRLFTLCTKNSMYQMKADDKGILLHTYYGRKTDICDYSYLIQRRDHGFSGNLRILWRTELKFSRFCEKCQL